MHSLTLQVSIFRSEARILELDGSRSDFEKGAGRTDRVGERRAKIRGVGTFNLSWADQGRRGKVNGGLAWF